MAISSTSVQTFNSSHKAVGRQHVTPQQLSLPRILCFHGGGSNARIFRAQCRSLHAQLAPYFHLCFVNAPFICKPGPDIMTVYRDYGPFRRWLRWLPEHPEIEPAVAVSYNDRAIQEAMAKDDCQGFTGPWVGVLGFSQGAKICASLLLRQQLGQANTQFRFGVLFAGRGPLVSLDNNLIAPPPGLHDASELSLHCDELTSPCKRHILRVPTVHVHGLRDPGLKKHQCLLKRYCDPQSTRLVVWDGEHRVPLKSVDTAAVVREILAVAKDLGVVE